MVGSLIKIQNLAVTNFFCLICSMNHINYNIYRRERKNDNNNNNNDKMTVIIGLLLRFQVAG